MKNVFWSLLGLSVITLSACSSADDVPEGILPPERMVGILADIHELEAKVADLRLTYDSSVALFAEQQQLLFEKHQVTDSTYVRSFDFYLEHVDQFDKIYAAIVDSLSLRRNMGTRKEEESGESI